jgi:tetratricopeptide (TPR) repeat protein
MGRLRRYLEAAVWLLLALALGAAAWSASRWLQIGAINRSIESHGVEPLLLPSRDPRVRYAAGWQAERALRYDDAVQSYTDAQHADDPELAARAWFALGNAYFKVGIAASREYEAKAGPVFENAQYDLARDAYRSALRIEPALAGVRYNLELLERLAPGRRLDGWLRNTDPVMLVPDRHNGWTSMQDDRKRGLP